MITDNQGVGTILNDDIFPTVSIDDVQITEGQAGYRYIFFNVSLAGVPGFPVEVFWEPAGGTADSSDYAINPIPRIQDPLKFGPGRPSCRRIFIRVYGDLNIEENETFIVRLVRPTNGLRISDAEGIGTIVTDDVPPITTLLRVEISTFLALSSPDDFTDGDYDVKMLFGNNDEVVLNTVNRTLEGQFFNFIGPSAGLWTASRVIELPALSGNNLFEQSSFEVKIAVFDEDDGPDDCMDINPGSGQADLRFEVDLRTGRWENVGGLGSEAANWPNTLAIGNAEGNKARVTFQIHSSIANAVAALRAETASPAGPPVAPSDSVLVDTLNRGDCVTLIDFTGGPDGDLLTNIGNNFSKIIFQGGTGADTLIQDRTGGTGGVASAGVVSELRQHDASGLSGAAERPAARAASPGATLHAWQATSGVSGRFDVADDSVASATVDGKCERCRRHARVSCGGSFAVRAGAASLVFARPNQLGNGIA